jgi:hypothetical protein
MALKFLSKKRWHTRRLENIRKVAEAEAQQAEEQTRMSELRREREEERAMEQLRRLQEASGRIPKEQPRLEFIYKTPVAKKPTEEEVVTREEILAQQRADAVMRSNPASECVSRQMPGVKWLDGTKPNRGDEEIRMREDPMTAIMAKRQRDRKEAEDRRELLRQLQDQRGKTSRPRS